MDNKIEVNKQKQKEELKQFKKQILEYVSKEDLKEVKLLFKKPTGHSYNNIKSVTFISTKDESVIGSICYNDEVFRTWHLEKTNKCWLMTFDYKNIRYKNLEKAVKRLIERIKQKVKNKEYKKRINQKKEKQKEIIKRLAKENGFKFEKCWTHWGNEYYIEKDCVRAKIKIKDDKVIITQYTVKKEIDIKELKQIIKNNTNIKKEVDING